MRSVWGVLVLWLHRSVVITFILLCSRLWLPPQTAALNDLEGLAGDGASVATRVIIPIIGDAHEDRIAPVLGLFDFLARVELRLDNFDTTVVVFGRSVRRSNCHSACNICMVQIVVAFQINCPQWRTVLRRQPYIRLCQVSAALLGGLVRGIGHRHGALLGSLQLELILINGHVAEV